MYVRGQNAPPLTAHALTVVHIPMPETILTSQPGLSLDHSSF